LRLFRHILAGDMENVLVMAKGEVDLVETAIGFVDAIFRLVLTNLAVWVGRKKFRENNLVGVSATNRERITHYGPLRLPIQTKNFSKIVQKARENEPAWMAILSNGFGRLEEMLDLREISVWITVVNQSV